MARPTQTFAVREVLRARLLMESRRERWVAGSVTPRRCNGGWTAGFFETMQLSELFGSVAATTIVAGVVLIFLVKPIKRLISTFSPLAV